MTISLAVDLGAVARVLGIKTNFVDLRQNNILLLPQHLGVVGQGNSLSVYSTDKADFTSALAVANTYGFGSPLHLAALQIFPDNGDGVGTIPVTFHPMEDDASGAPSVGDVTPTVAQTVDAQYRVKINNILSAAFTIVVADTIATVVAKMVTAVNAVLEMPVIATDNISVDMTLTSKWEGLSANDLFVELEGDFTLGTTFAITQPVGGLVNPDVQPSLNQIGNIWESMILNCLNISDTVALDAYAAFGEGRFGALEHKPLMVFSGETEVDQATAIVLPESRKNDRTNSQLVAPGSNDLPFVVAARQLARIVVLANNNPPHDYGGQQATGLTPGADGVQWDYPERDAAVKGGSSTTTVVDGVVNIADVVTFYHPTGDTQPAYRFVVDFVKVQNIIFTINLIFATAEWDGAPLVPNEDAITNPTARKPKDAVADINAALDGLGLAAILSNVAAAKPKTIAGINESNPKRLDVKIEVQISGNSNIISFDNDFGFFFGTLALAA